MVPSVIVEFAAAGGQCDSRSAVVGATIRQVSTLTGQLQLSLFIQPEAHLASLHNLCLACLILSTHPQLDGVVVVV